MYYLWEDKQEIFYITDYKEIREDGKVKVDRFGFIDAKLMHSSEVKMDCITEAQKLKNQNQN